MCGQEKYHHGKIVLRVVVAAKFLLWIPVYPADTEHIVTRIAKGLG